MRSENSRNLGMKASLNYLTTEINMDVGQQLKSGCSQSDLPMHPLSLEEG